VRSCTKRRRYARPMDQTVQVVGALLILFAYAAAQFGALNQRSRVYLVLNLLGSAVLTLLAWREEQWGFLLLSRSKNGAFGSGAVEQIGVIWR
jgi:hypothetical protein